MTEREFSAQWVLNVRAVSKSEVDMAIKKAKESYANYSEHYPPSKAGRKPGNGKSGKDKKR